ncbi:hypothetical protein OIE52_39530 [Streptomyces canus]|uniref:hypothetical protein n=1 Tax=Streptomyces canus TaxID=58343 RepID=UPI003243D854
MSLLGDLLEGPIQGDSQVTWKGGDSVRRVERRRRVDWYLNGAPVSEETARAFIAAKDQASREFLLPDA